MEKYNLEEDLDSKVNEWTYPDINLLLRKKQKLEIDENAELNSAKREVESLKLEHINKIQLLNQLITKLENPLQTLDTEISELMQDMIYTTIKKLIYKELKSDPKVIIKIINELKESIQEKSGIINVFLSETDFEKIKKIGCQSDLIMHANPNLSEGDVILKTNYNEIRSILGERIDKIFRNNK